LFENINFLKNLSLCKKQTKAQQHLPAMLLAHEYQLEVQLFDCYEDLGPVEKNVIHQNTHQISTSRCFWYCTILINRLTAKFDGNFVRFMVLEETFAIPFITSGFLDLFHTLIILLPLYLPTSYLPKETAYSCFDKG